jgi:hypothetical protein
MKRAVLIAMLSLFAAGCQVDPEAAKTTSQTPQFGTPTSSIPWNRPEDWEQSGPLGSMPETQGQGRARSGGQ